MKNKPKYWPGTDIIKSMDNDFNWRKRVPTVTKEINQYETKSRAGSKGAEKYMENRNEPDQSATKHIDSTSIVIAQVALFHARTRHGSVQANTNQDGK